MVGPLALAARAWVPGVLLTAAAVALGWFLGRRFHRLARRWLVLVPAGVVVHDHLVLLCANIGGRAHVAVSVSDTVVAARNLDAAAIIRDVVSPMIKGGGGGQKTLATAGGQEVGQLQDVIQKVRELLK